MTFLSKSNKFFPSTQVMDNGVVPGPLSNTTTCNITLIDVNDKDPVIYAPLDIVVINEVLELPCRSMVLSDLPFLMTEHRAWSPFGLSRSADCDQCQRLGCG